jgi:uncharacterized membrane protein YccC
VAASDDGDKLRATTFLRVSEFVDHWCRFERTLHAIATGTQTPPGLRAAAKRAWPVRSADYVLGLFDAAPMALALGFTAALWFATTWTSSINAMLFAFIALGFVGGTPSALRSSQGIVLWIALTCAITLVYQFGLLPRVTAFPVLIAAIMFFIVPLSLLMTMSPAGLLIVANGFALIGLQDAYAADFGASLETLGGSLAGSVIAAAALYLLQFDRVRFSARRLARALEREVVDIAQAWRLPDPDRLVSLSVDRLALHAGAVAALPQDDPERRRDLVGALCVALDLLRLRTQEGQLSVAAQKPIAA